MSAVASKDTIYIDAEDEITAIIDKVRGSKGKIVALVLPKRAAALQSTINLKLLKRTAIQAKKNIVLITSDTNLLPMAGAVGLHVAKTLQTKPAIPPDPHIQSDDSTVVSEQADSGDALVDRTASIGQLAGHVAGEETIELNNDIDVDETSAGAGEAKKSIGKKLKIPDFDRFRLMLFGGIGLLILFIVGGFFGLVVLPKAKIVIKTDTANVKVDLLITADGNAKAVDTNQLILPMLNKQSKKTDSEKALATGQRDDGTKATGTVTITNCDGGTVSDGVTLPAGTVLSTSANGGSLAFLTTESITIPQSNFTSSHVCKNDSFKNVSVTAQGAGGQYNLSAHRTFSIAVSGVSGTDSSAMTGGTSKLVQVVSQQDIDNAKQKILDRLNPAATSDLNGQFSTDNAQALTDTFTAGPPAITSSPNVNQTGTDVTVNLTITYSEAGIKKDDLKQLVENEVKKHIDSSKQAIQDNGLNKATIRVTDKKSPTLIKFNVQSLAIAGPQLDADGIKKQVAGKKKGETASIIQSRPGIQDVTVTYSPFWVFSTPKNTKHITITFDQSNASR